MSTTAIFVELLLTGLQAAIWLSLVILSVLGFDWIHPERLKGFEAMLTVLLLPIVYPLGVLVDYLADQLFRKWELKIRAEWIQDQTQTALKLLIQTKDPALATLLSYFKSRIRISRSSALNFALITIMSVAFTIIRCRAVTGFPFWRTLLLEILLGAALTGLAMMSWHGINRTFFKSVVRGYDSSANG